MYSDLDNNELLTLEYMKNIHPEIFYNKLHINIRTEDFNYIVNTIVEWTISDTPFDDFVEQVKEDKRFYNNMFSFVWCLSRDVIYHIKYLIFVIGRIAEKLKLNGLIYIICSDKYNLTEFEHNYIDLINKRFDENNLCVFTPKYNFIDEIVKVVKANDIIDDNYLYYIPYFINYCILSNNITLFKQFLIFADENTVFYINSNTVYNHFVNNCFNNKFICWTIDFYRTLNIPYDIDSHITQYQYLNLPVFNTNKLIVDNFEENYEILPQHKYEWFLRK